MRIVLQDKPRITVCFPPTFTQEDREKWLENYKEGRRKLH
jgi:hypothetical protein